MDFKSELTSNGIILLTLNNLDYQIGTSEVLKNFTGDRILYIILNKTFPFIDEVFKDIGLV